MCLVCCYYGSLLFYVISEIFTAVKVLRGLPDLNPMQTSTVSMSQKLAAPLQNTEVTEQAGSFETYANTNNTIRSRKPEEDTLCSCDGVVVTSLLLMCHNMLSYF